jgi:GDP-L-fucose synthase
MIKSELKKKLIYIAGHNGMVGSAIYRDLQKEGYDNLLTINHVDLDLKEENKVDNFFKINKPNIVIMCAAKVGGIKANINNPVSFLLDNIKIQNNLISKSVEYGVEKLIFIASSCIYPTNCEQPMEIKYLFNGRLEPTNEGYAIAKIAGIKLLEAYRKEYSFNSISVIPCNLYGPNDSFDPVNSHVLSGLVKKFYDSFKANHKKVKIWGTGIARREFMHVYDFAKATRHILENETDFIINVGSSKEISINELANLISQEVGYKGLIEWDESQPDGMLRKLMDNSELQKLGFKCEISLIQGIRQMIHEYSKLKG